MSVYYNFYLEKKIPEGWQTLKKSSIEDPEEEQIIYWHTGSHGSDFEDNYSLGYISFEDYSIEMKKEYQNSYDRAKKEGCYMDSWYPKFCQMDLQSMVRDFEDNIHECEGIISKNQRLKLQRNSYYEPSVVDPKDFNKLPTQIQENYIFYSWDSPWSEYGHIYDIIPIVYDLLEKNNLSIENVRLVYYVA